MSNVLKTGASKPDEPQNAAAHARMDPTLKAKWVAALRSGKYRQGSTRLEFAGSYCCLGVLRDVADHDDARSDANVLLTAEQLAQYKLSLSAQTNLAHMNDTARKSFPEIADWIEANL